MSGLTEGDKFRRVEVPLAALCTRQYSASVVTGILRIGPSPLALPRIKITPHDYGTALAVTQRAKL
jgi:hypothetical protein